MAKKITVIPRGGVVGMKPPVAPTPKLPTKPPITRSSQTGAVIITPEYEAWMKAMQEAGRTRQLAPTPTPLPKPKTPTPTPLWPKIQPLGEGEKMLPGEVYKGLKYWMGVFQKGYKENVRPLIYPKK